jgi:hypothetical protein
VNQAGGTVLTSEIKFLVESAVGERIREWARGRLPADPHGGGPSGDQYLITSVYLDTPALDVFYRRRSFRRSKFRIRRYERAEAVFLERKLRTGMRLAKRRTPVDMAVLPCLANGGPPSRDPAHWFHRRLALRKLRPICQITYLRTARVAQTDRGPVRLTIDEAVSAAPTGAFTFVDTPGTPLLQGQMILELKYSGYPPAVFRELIETFGLAPRAASKYRFAMEALGVVPMHA